MALERSCDSAFAETQALLDDVGDVDLQVPIRFLDALQDAQSGDDVVTAFSEWSSRLFTADHVCLSLQNTADSVTTLGSDTEFEVKQAANYPMSDTTVGRVIQMHQPLFVQNCAEAPGPDMADLHNLGLSCALIAPIFRSNRCFGAITAGFTEPPARPNWMLAALQTIGRCMATQFLQVEQIDDLMRAATTDPLTLVGNRRRFNELSVDIWDSWMNGAPPFSLILVDIDHFKSVNDQYGHDVGDEVIRGTAQRLVETTRDGDEVIRMGGEEFCIVLKDTDLKEAETLAERCRLHLCGSPFQSTNLALDVTASFGVATVGKTDYSMATLSRRMDQALYTAKAKGRNQVEISIEEVEDALFFG